MLVIFVLIRASPRIFKTHFNLDILTRLKKKTVQQLPISTPNLPVLGKNNLVISTPNLPVLGKNNLVARLYMHVSIMAIRILDVNYLLSCMSEILEMVGGRQ